MHFGAQIPRWFLSRQQPLVAGALVFALLAGTLGVPVLVDSRRDLSRPFPCMHHRCGCGSADSCWHGCCCMSLAQKLAWAKENGVTPPDYALAPAEEEVCALHDEHDSPQGCSSCSSKNGVCKTEAADDNDHSVELGLIKIEDFRRCNGLASLWLTIGCALPPKIETKMQRYDAAPSDWVRVASQSAESLALSPATPPPRHS